MTLQYWTQFETDNETDGQMHWKKTICLPTLMGGDIILLFSNQRPLQALVKIHMIQIG